MDASPRAPATPNPAALVHPATTELTSVGGVQLGHISRRDQTREQTCLRAQIFLKGGAGEQRSTSPSDTGPRGAAIGALHTLISGAADLFDVYKSENGYSTSYLWPV